jgi:aspartyl aminopeptidase
VKEGEKVVAKVVTIKKPLFSIPSLAIHLTPGRYEEMKVNPEQHLALLVSSQCNERKATGHPSLVLEMIAKELGVNVDQIVGMEMRVCDAQLPCFVGVQEEFLAGQGIDNLNGTYSCLTALIGSANDLKEETNIRLVTIFDHEEVGSSSFTGADSVLMANLIKRILNSFRVSEAQAEQRNCGGQGYEITLRNSFVISVDNAHAVHPNYPERHEAKHAPFLNAGPVIKVHCKQRYATEVEGTYLIKELAKKCGVPVQEFVVRQDSPSGSTIGPSTAKNSGIRTMDIGNPQLAMHSIREICGSDDITYMTRLLETFLKSFPKTPMPECH